MKFNRIVIVSLLLLSIKSMGQNSNVQSAISSLNFKDLPKAKEYIDLAAENESTKNNSKMWFYRGKIYISLRRNKDFKDANPDGGEISLTSYLNALKTDDKGWFKDEILDGGNSLSIFTSAVDVYNTAGAAYSKKDYPKAIRLYNLIKEVFPYDKKNELNRSNITPEFINYNSAVVSLNAGDNATAKQSFEKLIEANYNDPKVYLNLSKIYSSEKDTTKSIDILEKGLVKFPGNEVLVTEQLFLSQNNPTKFIDKLTKALEERPDDEKLLGYRASTYAKQNQNDKAVADYKKILSINADNFDANYRLGALLFNDGAEMLNKANDIKNEVEYKKAKVKAEDKIKEAIPFFEKAKEINPSDKTNLMVLKQIYARLNDTEKYNKTKADLDNLNK